MGTDLTAGGVRSSSTAGEETGRLGDELGTTPDGGWIAMATTRVPALDDEILPYTRALSVAIVPFLVAGFAVLYIWPDHTAQLWAWPIRPPMTSMMLASAYLGGTYFFLQVPRQPHWHVVATGFL